MNHPGEQELALYSSGDLGILNMLRVRRHVRGCPLCSGELEGYQSVRQILAADNAEMPAGLNWERLSEEMTANIHLGLEAGEIVGPVRTPRPERIGWRAAAVMAGLSAVLVAAWWLNPPHAALREMAMRSADPVEIRTAPGGIEVKGNGSAMTLLHTRGDATIIVSAPGTLRARFVDEDTGQVTINNVYTD